MSDMKRAATSRQIWPAIAIAHICKLACVTHHETEPTFSVSGLQSTQSKPFSYRDTETDYRWDENPIFVHSRVETGTAMMTSVTRKQSVTGRQRAEIEWQSKGQDPSSEDKGPRCPNLEDRKQDM